MLSPCEMASMVDAENTMTKPISTKRMVATTSMTRGSMISAGTPRASAWRRAWSRATGPVVS